MAIGAQQDQIFRCRSSSIAVLVNGLGVMALNDALSSLTIPLCEIEATYLAAQGTKFLHCPFFLRINKLDASFPSLVKLRQQFPLGGFSKTVVLRVSIRIFRQLFQSFSNSSTSLEKAPPLC